MKITWDKKQINYVRKLNSQGYSRTEISKMFRQKFNLHRTPDSIKHCIQAYCSDSEEYTPNVLILDIETSPLVGFVWGLFDQNIPLNMLIKDWFILSFSAKWLGSSESEVIYADQRNKKGKSLHNDKPLLVKIKKLLDKADIVITQNGISFDMKKINARLIEHGLDAPTHYKNIDTLRIAKKHFGFTSNKLEYMTKKLCTKYKKQEHSDFSGFKLWDECLKGNMKAWKSMEKYNKYDVLSLEELFLKLAKYDKSNTVALAVKAYNKAISK